MTVCEIGYKYSYPSYILWIKWDATFKHLPPYIVNNSTELPYLPTRLCLTSLISNISRTHPDSISFDIQRIYSFTGHLMTVNKSLDIFLIFMETIKIERLKHKGVNQEPGGLQGSCSYFIKIMLFAVLSIHETIVGRGT